MSAIFIFNIFVRSELMLEFRACFKTRNQIIILPMLLFKIRPVKQGNERKLYLSEEMTKENE